MEDLTERIKEILDMPKKDVDVNEAALVLLKVNRNQILHNNIIRRKDVDKVLYELEKVYKFRMQDETIKEVPALEEKAIEIAANNPDLDDKEAKPKKGAREDHDALPDEVKALILENQNIFPRIRKLHEQLKLMSAAPASERHPFLKEMVQLDTKLRKNWDLYDNYKPGDDLSALTKAPVEVDPKKVSAARKYLSTNLPKLEELTDKDKIAELLEKMQERYDYLVATDSGISEEQVEKFKTAGLNV